MSEDQISRSRPVTSRNRKEASRVSKLGRQKSPERRKAGTRITINTADRSETVDIEFVDAALEDLAYASIEKNLP